MAVFSRNKEQSVGPFEKSCVQGLTGIESLWIVIQISFQYDLHMINCFLVIDNLFINKEKKN